MMAWAGGNPNFNPQTGEMIPEDSPMWRDPETGEYVNQAPAFDWSTATDQQSRNDLIR